jgi:hypothetical protein
MRSMRFMHGRASHRKSAMNISRCPPRRKRRSGNYISSSPKCFSSCNWTTSRPGQKSLPGCLAAHQSSGTLRISEASGPTQYPYDHPRTDQDARGSAGYSIQSLTVYRHPPFWTTYVHRIIPLFARRRSSDEFLFLAGQYRSAVRRRYHFQPAAVAQTTFDPWRRTHRLKPVSVGKIHNLSGWQSMAQELLFSF